MEGYYQIRKMKIQQIILIVCLVYGACSNGGSSSSTLSFPSLRFVQQVAKSGNNLFISRDLVRIIDTVSIEQFSKCRRVSGYLYSVHTILQAYRFKFTSLLKQKNQGKIDQLSLKTQYKQLKRLIEEQRKQIHSKLILLQKLYKQYNQLGSLLKQLDSFDKFAQQQKVQIITILNNNTRIIKQNEDSVKSSKEIVEMITVQFNTIKLKLTYLDIGLENIINLYSKTSQNIIKSYFSCFGDRNSQAVAFLTQYQNLFLLNIERSAFKRYLQATFGPGSIQIIKSNYYTIPLSISTIYSNSWLYAYYPFLMLRQFSTLHDADAPSCQISESTTILRKGKIVGIKDNIIQIIDDRGQKNIVYLDACSKIQTIVESQQKIPSVGHSIYWKGTIRQQSSNKYDGHHIICYLQ